MRGRRRLGLDLLLGGLALASSTLGCLSSGNRPASRGIGAVRALSGPAGANSGEPQLTEGRDGRVYLSWLEARAGNRSALLWSVLEGERWSAPRVIAEGDSFFVNWADCPSVVDLGAGRMAAHWLWSRSQESYDVRVSLSSDGGKSWGPPVVPHRDRTATEHGFASLAPETDGVRVVWLDGRNFARPLAQGADADAGPGADMMLRTAAIRFGTGAGGDSLLDARVCDCCQTAVAATPSGLLVAYRDREPDETRDIALARMGAGGPRGTEPGPRDGWVIAGCPVNGPALDARDQRVVLAWFTAAGDSARVKVAFSGDGGERFDPPVRVDGGSPLGRVDVVLLEDGSAVVTWLEARGEAGVILARRVVPGGSPREPLEVARTALSRASGVPRLARAGRRLIFAWTETGVPPRVRSAEANLTP